MGHSYRTLLWDTLVGHSCRDTVCPHTRSSHASVSYETSSKSHASRLQDERFVRDFLLKSRVKSPKRSVSYETSSKSHTSSLQNERFVRDFLQKSRVNSPKRAFRTRLPQKLTCQSLQNERFVRDFLQKSSGNTHRSTHITQPCQAVSRFQPLQTTPAHTPIPMRQRQSPLPQLTTSRFPAPATQCHLRHTSQPHDSLRCHENHTSMPQNPHKVLRLPRKVTISSHVSFNKICTTPHGAHSHPPKSPFQLRLVTKTELRCHTLKRKSQWHGHIQHPKNTTLQMLIPMELQRKLRVSQNAAPVQRSASRFLRDMSFSCKSQWNSVAN